MNLEPSRFFSARKHLRVSNPPGGASNIFGHADQPDQPRKIRDNQKSSIFGADHPDNLKAPIDAANEEDERNFLSPRHQEDTKQRLFGANESACSPRRLNDTWRSNLGFSASSDCLSNEASKKTPRRSPSAGINPVTGELLLASTPTTQENGVALDVSGVKNGNGIDEDDCMTNGHNKGENGYHNGKDDDLAKKTVQNGRQPPGGKSNGIF